MRVAQYKIDPKEGRCLLTELNRPRFDVAERHMQAMSRKVRAFQSRLRETELQLLKVFEGRGAEIGEQG